MQISVAYPRPGESETLGGRYSDLHLSGAPGESGGGDAGILEAGRPVLEAVPLSSWGSES